MKYISCDIETTGLDPDTCQILQMAMVLEDTQYVCPVNDLPHLCITIGTKDGIIKGEPYAIRMNARLISEIAEGRGMHMMDALVAFERFVDGVKITTGKKVIMAGKNFDGFDRRFIRRCMPSVECMFSHKTIDPATLYWTQKDTSLPSLDNCLARAGITDTVSHDALSDARQVIQVLRAKGFCPTST